MTTTPDTLVGDLVGALLAETLATGDRLYEIERQRRQALEVHIDNVLRAFASCEGGTVAQYERVVDALARRPYGEREQILAAQHRENDTL